MHISVACLIVKKEGLETFPKEVRQFVEDKMDEKTIFGEEVYICAVGDFEPDDSGYNVAYTREFFADGDVQDLGDSEINALHWLYCVGPDEYVIYWDLGIH